MNDSEPKSGDDFQARLKAARAEFDKMEEQTGRSAPRRIDENTIRSGRAGSELLANVFAGAFLGYLIDKFFSTAPWGLIAMMVLGFVSGVLRANAAMKKNNQNLP